jgi:hypothetical protein
MRGIRHIINHIFKSLNMEKNVWLYLFGFMIPYITHILICDTIIGFETGMVTINHNTLTTYLLLWCTPYILFVGYMNVKYYNEETHPIPKICMVPLHILCLIISWNENSNDLF